MAFGKEAEHRVGMAGRPAMLPLREAAAPPRQERHEAQRRQRPVREQTHLPQLNEVAREDGAAVVAACS